MNNMIRTQSTGFEFFCFGENFQIRIKIYQLRKIHITTKQLTILKLEMVEDT